MVGATANGVTVCCPECGGVLRVSFADGGSIVGCHRCGEAVRVPVRPHPVETPTDSLSPLPASVARQAASGVRLLQVSLVLFPIEHLFTATVLTLLWVGRYPALLGLALGLDVGLLITRTVVRWAGYRRCESAAAIVGADGWLRWARWAPVVRLAGYLAAVGPWAIGGQAIDLRAIAPLATLAWSVGGVLEFVAVAAWGRLLTILGDRYAVNRTARYAVLVSVMVAVVAAGLVVVRVVAVIADRRVNPNRQLPAGWAELPADALPAVAGLMVLTGSLAAVAWAYYARILIVLRHRLRTG